MIFKFLVKGNAMVLRFYQNWPIVKVLNFKVTSKAKVVSFLLKLADSSYLRSLIKRQINNLTFSYKKLLTLRILNFQVNGKAYLYHKNVLLKKF